MLPLYTVNRFKAERNDFLFVMPLMQLHRRKIRAQLDVRVSLHLSFDTTLFLERCPTGKCTEYNLLLFLPQLTQLDNNNMNPNAVWY